MEAFVDDGQARQALEWLGAGSLASFCVDGDGALCCRVCGLCQAPDVAAQSVLRDVAPISGDPSTRALAVRCPGCGEQGIALVPYRPVASAGERSLLAAVEETLARGTR